MNILYKNATNRHELCLGEAPAAFADILISYRQGGRIVMRRTKRELCFEEQGADGGQPRWIASWEIRPEETMRFGERLPVFMQALKLRHDGGQEPGEIVELDVVEALDHSTRGVKQFEPNAWRSPF